MTNHADSSRSTDSGVSGNAQTSAREIRKDAAKAWLKANQRDFLMRLMRADCPTLGDEIAGYMGEFAESECSRLASRVEELEKGLREIYVLLDGPLSASDKVYCLKLLKRKNGAGAHAEEKE